MKKKKSKKITYVTRAEHERWHKKHGSCGSGKEHEACMKKWGIRIKDNQPFGVAQGKKITKI